MSVTIGVFYKKGGTKKGSPVTNAEFFQLIQQPKLGPGFPGATQVVQLPIIQQTGSQYVLSPAAEPLNSSSFTIQVKAADNPPMQGGTENVGVAEGGAAEVWLGNER